MRSRMDVRSKKVWMLSGLLFQDFFEQIIQHEMMAAGERLDEAGGSAGPCWQRPLQGEGGQLQAGNPAFGAAFQCGDVFGREIEAHHLVEEFGGFGGGEAQVGGAQLGQLAPGAVAGPGGDGDPRGWR